MESLRSVFCNFLGGWGVGVGLLYFGGGGGCVVLIVFQFVDFLFALDLVSMSQFA